MPQSNFKCNDVSRHYDLDLKIVMGNGQMTPVSGLPIKKYAGIFIAFELTLYTYIYFLYASLFLKKVFLSFN